MKTRLGLLGKNISHSKSPEIYKELLGRDIEYKLFDYSNAKDIPSLNDFFEKVEGLSITSPYKTHFLNDLKLDESAIKVGAINCIYRRDGFFYGTNTDYSAIEVILQKLIAENAFSQIVVLGSGVMAKVVLELVLKLKGLLVDNYTRKSHGDLSHFDFKKKYQTKVLCINACSRDFFFQGNLPLGSLYWDLNYGIAGQKEIIEKHLSSYVDGLELLKLQARHALAFWSIK